MWSSRPRVVRECLEKTVNGRNVYVAVNPVGWELAPAVVNHVNTLELQQAPGVTFEQAYSAGNVGRSALGDSFAAGIRLLDKLNADATLMLKKNCLIPP